jgi:NAD(P)-dependent dehydrogenase (short-subunit alcohol dehydrogenase family)
MSQLVAPRMLEAGHGSIVNMPSGARFGIRATASCVAKGGLEALHRATAQEHAPKIRVNAIALGSFATSGLPQRLEMTPGSLAKMNESTPLHRLGDAEDLGRLTVDLSTRDCRATNAIFYVDRASIRTIRRSLSPATDLVHGRPSWPQFQAPDSQTPEPVLSGQVPLHMGRWRSKDHGECRL